MIVMKVIYVNLALGQRELLRATVRIFIWILDIGAGTPQARQYCHVCSEVLAVQVGLAQEMMPVHSVTLDHYALVVLMAIIFPPELVFNAEKQISHPCRFL